MPRCESQIVARRPSWSALRFFYKTRIRRRAGGREGTSGLFFGAPPRVIRRPPQDARKGKEAKRAGRNDREEGGGDGGGRNRGIGGRMRGGRKKEEGEDEKGEGGMCIVELQTCAPLLCSLHSHPAVLFLAVRVMPCHLGSDDQPLRAAYLSRSNHA